MLIIILTYYLEIIGKYVSQRKWNKLKTNAINIPPATFNYNKIVINTYWMSPYELLLLDI